MTLGTSQHLCMLCKSPDTHRRHWDVRLRLENVSEMLACEPDNVCMSVWAKEPSPNLLP